MRNLIALLTAAFVALVASTDRRVVAQAVPAAHDWPAYGGGPAAIRYSPLAQITRANVKSLRVAWTYDSGEEGGLQTNPIVVGRTLYTTTPLNKTVALDAATGAVRWTFDAGFKSRGPNRGVTYWTDGRSARIFAGRGPLPLCARCGDRQADRDVRPRRPDRSARRPRPAAGAAVGADDHAGRDLPRSADRRRPRQRRPACVARRHPRDTTSAPAPHAGRSGPSPRPVRPAPRRGRRRARHERRRQQLGRHGGRHGARHRVRADRIGGRRLLRRRPSSATTCTPTPCSRSTPPRASGCGISRPCTTTSGIAISRRRRRW